MSILDAPIARLDGTPATLGDLTGGGPALLVNVASKCGLTPQYAGLEQLQEDVRRPRLHRRRGALQPVRRPGARHSEEIAEFCSATYGVTFPMTEKIDVNGDDRHEVYSALVETPDEKGKVGDIAWNFEKFLVDADRRRARPLQPEASSPEDPRARPGGRGPRARLTPRRVAGGSRPTPAGDRREVGRG